MGADQSSSPAAEAWTVRRILEWTTGFLKQKGVESARLEAELLLAHARNCPRIRLYTDFEAIVTEDQRATMRSMVQRRASREPLAYIVGNKEFYGRRFEVGSGVLIPRPETEMLVDVCLEYIPADRPTRIIEVGFGSGCIAITLAKQRPLCHVSATDISADAKSIADRNVTRHEVADRVQLMHGDCLEPLASGAERFHGLVSNPPYVRDDELGGLQREIAEFEPHTALLAGEDGLNIVRRIISEVVPLLHPRAFIAFELDPAQCSTAAGLLRNAGFVNAVVRKDLSGIDRIISAVLPAEDEPQDAAASD